MKHSSPKTAVSAAHIYETLGGAEVFSREAKNLQSLRDQVRKGLPYSALEAVMRRLNLGRDEVSKALLLAPRTLTRRKAEKNLRPDESDRLFRLARIASQATEVFGSAEKAARWLQRANRALGGETPLSLLDTEVGARQVEELLGRISHGVPS